MSKRTEARQAARAAEKKRIHSKDKQKGPNNLLIALLIFGTLAIMFAVVFGINQSKLTKNIETYMSDMGGEALFGHMEIDDETSMAITAKGNKMTITVDCKTDNEKKAIKKYEDKDQIDSMEQSAAYYLYMMKSGCRGLSASVDYIVNVNKKEVQSIHLSYGKAKRLLKKSGMIE